MDRRDATPIPFWKNSEAILKDSINSVCGSIYILYLYYLYCVLKKVLYVLIIKYDIYIKKINYFYL